jgi:hypothetical protein
MLGLLGIAMLLNVPLEGAFVQNPGRIWTGIFSLLEAAIVIAAEEWILGIARTEADADARSSASPRLLRVGQALAGFYGLAGVVLPGTRRQVWQGVLIDQPGFICLPSLFSYRSHLRWPQRFTFSVLVSTPLRK